MIIAFVLGLVVGGSTVYGFHLFQQWSKQRKQLIQRVATLTAIVKQLQNKSDN